MAKRTRSDGALATGAAAASSMIAVDTARRFATVATSKSQQIMTARAAEDGARWHAVQAM
jgi:hypothetical protein